MSAGFRSQSLEQLEGNCDNDEKQSSLFSVSSQLPEIENDSKEGVEKTGQLFDMDLWSSALAPPPTP